MSLLARQTAFCAEIAAPDDGAPPSSPGMAIYRNAYRGRLVAALEEGFERTRRWVGDEAFGVAACHYVLAHPPRGWTLDTYAADFPALLAELFAGDPEVAELAWLEWHLQQAFAAPDRPSLDPAGLAVADHGDDAWARMRFTVGADFALRTVGTDCAALWEGLAADRPAPEDSPARRRASLVVWCQDLSPRYRLLDRAEGDALAALAAGESFGAIAAQCDPALLGAWLARWLGEGLFAAASPE